MAENNIQVICRKLKPIIGEKAERFWLAYLTEDQDGKREIEMALNLMAARHLGNNAGDSKVNLSVPSKEIASGQYPLGIIRYSNKDYYQFGLREDEWIQHMAIFGRSGAGKTNTVFVILDSLLANKKPFLIFDWKRNYRDILAVTTEAVMVYTVGRDSAPLVFNPLIPPTGTDPAIWLKKLIEIIAGAYYLGEGVMYLLQEGLHAVYQEFKVYEGKQDRYPTFLDVLAWLENNPVKGRKALWMDSALRGIKSICFGPMGKVVNTPVQCNLGQLLEHNVILELDALTNNDKNLIIESMLLWIHHFRMVESSRETFKHAIIIEEAHHILLKKPGGSGGEAVTDTTLREIRELGEAIILVDQHPSLISIPALGNSYTTIAMNLKHKSDVNAVAAAMLMDDDERDVLGTLPVGEAIVKLQGRWQQPFQIVIPHKKIPKGAIDDVRLTAIMGRTSILRFEMPEEIEFSPVLTSIADDEKALLIDICNHPYSGVVERYRRLAISRRKGDNFKRSLIAKELIIQVEIPTRSGRIVLLDLTQKAREYLEKAGLEARRRKLNEGLEHDFWKHKVADYYQKQGYAIKIEEPVNGFTDLVIEKDGEKTAVEIETGKSDWKKNLQKNMSKNFTKIIIFVTHSGLKDELAGKIDSELMQNRVSVGICQDVI
jgi:hypothetical protein